MKKSIFALFIVISAFLIGCTPTGKQPPEPAYWNVCALHESTTDLPPICEKFYTKPTLREGIDSVTVINTRVGFGPILWRFEDSAICSSHIIQKKRLRIESITPYYYDKFYVARPFKVKK